MGFRFYRRIKIFPGFRINVSRSGVSTSIGVRGAHVTVGHGKARETVGIPGSGLSYTAVQTHHEAPGQAQTPSATKRGVGYYLGVTLLAVVIVVAIVATYRSQP